MIFSDRKRPAAGTCKMPLSKRPKASEEASFAREEIKKQLKKMTRQVSCLLLGLRKGWLGMPLSYDKFVESEVIACI